MRRLAALETCAPGLFAWLASRCRRPCAGATCSSSTAAWRPGHSLDDLGVTTEEHLWVRSGFFDTPWDRGAFDAYQAAGIERVVFGHTPQWDGPTFHHEGHSLGIDTNAVGNPRMPKRRRPGADPAGPGRIGHVR